MHIEELMCASRDFSMNKQPLNKQPLNKAMSLDVQGTGYRLCQACGGVGYVKGPKGNKHMCLRCHGQGKIVRDPYLTK